MSAYSAAADYLTVLTAKGGALATKRIIAQPNGAPKIEQYGRAARFRIDEIGIDSFDRMVAALETLEKHAQSFVVRGKTVAGVNRENAKRRSRARKGEPATLEETPRRWLALDLDSIPCPAGIDPLWEPDDVIDHVVELLPEEFHGASVWWRLPPRMG